MDGNSLANEIGRGIVRLLIWVLIVGLGLGFSLPIIWGFIAAHVSIH